MPRIAFTIAVFVSACAACAQDKDPVRETLFAAKVAYDKEMAQYRKQADDWLDKREEAARKAGDKKAVDQIKEERKAFDEDGGLSKAAPTALKQKPVLAKKALESAYAEAVKTYTRARKDEAAAAVEKEWEEFAAKGSAVNLLALVEPKKDAVAGEWKLSGKVLVVTSGDRFARLQLPYEPGEEYDLEVKCKRTAGNEGFCVGLVAGDRQVLATIDAWPQFDYRSGLDIVDNKSVVDNVTAVKGGVLKSDVVHTLAYSVRSGVIGASLDGKPRFAFKGAFDRLGLAPGEQRVPNKKVLFLFVAKQTTYQIERVVVTPVKRKGKVLR